MLDTVKINHVQHISFTQPRLTDAVSVILRELLSYEHPSNAGDVLLHIATRYDVIFGRIMLIVGDIKNCFFAKTAS